jgi:microcystin-dependent protein
MAEDIAPNLVGKRISTTFRGLLHLPHSIDIANPDIKQIVYDGQGTPSALTVAASGYGAQIFGNLAVDKSVTVGSNLIISDSMSISGNITTNGDINLINGGKVNNVYFPQNSTSLSLSAPAALNIGKINLVETTSDYEINFGTDKLFSIYVKKDNPHNLYIKPSGTTSESNSPLWINTITNEVNISNLRLSSIATNPSVKTPIGTDSYRNVIPVGSILMFPSLTIPNGWFECNGNELSRSDYGDLYDVIGYVYGSGSGSNFRLPDLRGVFVRGLDHGKGINTGRSLGSFEDDLIKTHQHISTGTLPLVYNGGTTIQRWETSGLPSSWAGTVNSDDLLQGNNIGGGGETRPKNYALVYCIKW